MGVVREPRLGLSAARNAGVRAARGEILLFTDDDVLLDAGWLVAYVAAAARWPAATYFAGRIDPEFEAPLRRWIARDPGAVAGMLVRLDLGGDERRPLPEERPFGPNMAVRRRAFERTGFDERVGRRGSEQVRCSETSLILELARQGDWGVWVPAAGVVSLRVAP